MNRRASKVFIPLLVLAGGLSGGTEARAQRPAKYEFTVERNVAVKMRDGVTLRADIYRPKGEGKFPVLLERTPYDKTQGELGARGAERGYVVVIQDTRGRYASQGEWYPFRNLSLIHI